jgi:hypothetical protein
MTTKSILAIDENIESSNRSSGNDCSGGLDYIGDG